MPTEPSNRKERAGDESVSELWKRLYRQVLEAEDQIAQAAYSIGVPHARVEAALDTAEQRMTRDEEREDLVFASLRNFVAELGGRLELRAVFGDETVVVRREPN